MRFLIAFACLVAGLFALPVAAAEKRIDFPGTDWSMVPPAGFELTRSPITMFLHPSKAVILIVQFPVRPIDKSEFGEVGSTQGSGANVSTLTDLREISIGGKRAFLMKARMFMRDSDMIAVVISGQGSMGMVSAVLPDAAKSSVEMAIIEAALHTVEEKIRTIEDRIGDLPYSLGDLAGMRVTDILAGSFVIVTDGPLSDYHNDTKQPYGLIFVADMGGQPADFIRDVEPAKQRLLQEYPNAEILGHKVIGTGKGDVLEISYIREAGSDKVKLSGTAWFRIDGSKLLFMLTQYPAGQVDAYDRLTRIRDGLAVKSSPAP